VTTTFTDATPMVTVHAQHHNDLSAAVDNLQGLVGNSVLSGTWRWTTSTTDASASGRVGINQATWAATSQLNLNETTLAGGDATNVLAKLKIGDGFYLQDHTDASRWARYTISGTPVDQGTWRQFPVTFVDGTEPTPANNADTIVTLTVQGGTSAALDAKVDKDSVVAAATRVVANLLAAGDTQPAWRVLGSGQMEWGAGGASAPDTILYRSSAGLLSVGSATQKTGLRVFGGVSGDIAVESRVAAEANPRWNITNGGVLSWGSGSGAQDTTIQRVNPGLLYLGLSTQKGSLRIFGAATTDLLIDHRVTTDANPRFSVRADGLQAWGDGTNPQDVTLWRFAAGALALGTSSQKGRLRAYGSGTTDNAVETLITTDAQFRWYVRADGQQWWGDGASVPDTNLYRWAADRLRTNDLLVADLGVQTKVKAGTPVDADWTAAPPDGTLVADSTGSKLWVRVGGVWKGVVVA
jgi:hypothetical protein